MNNHLIKIAFWAKIAVFVILTANQYFYGIFKLDLPTR